MKPSKINHRQSRLFDIRLSKQLNPKKSLYQLSHQIDWKYFETEFGKLFKSNLGQPPKPIRLIVGLLMLQHIFNESDELVVSKWVENPYWQLFCGYDYLQWEEPIDPNLFGSLEKKTWKRRLRKNFNVNAKLKCHPFPLN